MVCKSQPYKIDELARLVHPRDGHPKIFAMIEAYLDESGIHDGAPVCVIAGYFGGIGQWKKFEARWRKTLARFNVPLEKFHAKELIKRTGFFSGWKNSDHSAFLDAITAAIIEYKIHPASVGIVLDDFRACSLPQQQFLTGAKIDHGKVVTSGNPSKPYFAPFQAVIDIICGYAPVGGKAHFFFGLDRHFAGYAMEYMKAIAQDTQVRFSDRIGIPSFPLAKETPQLQAADYLSYLTYQDMQERVKNNRHQLPPSRLHSILARGISSDDFLYFEKDSIRETLEKTYALQGNWDGHLSPERDNPI